MLSSAQNPTKAFYKTHKKKEGVFNIKVPGWLIWVGAGMVYNGVNNPEAKAAIKMARHIKTTRVMYSEGAIDNLRPEIESFVNQISKKNFDELVTVNSDGTYVRVMGNIKRDKIKQMVILVDDDGELAYVSAKSNLRVKHISNLIKYYMYELPDLKEKQRQKEKRREARKERRKRSKVKLPQA
ncbi:MAG: DUF4252 domain-containing protein, partial [Bacteroidota bacterium]